MATRFYHAKDRYSRFTITSTLCLSSVDTYQTTLKSVRLLESRHTPPPMTVVVN